MSSRAILAALCVVGAALLAALGWVVFALEADAPDLSWQLTRIEVGNPDELRVTIVVDKRPGARALCQVAAFTEQDRSAGRLDGIVVAPRGDGSRITELTVVVPTEKPATRAQISQCVLDDPSG